MRLANSPIAHKLFLSSTKVAGRYSSWLAQYPVARLWFTPWRVPLSERAISKQQGWLRATEPFTRSTRHGRVSGYVAGAGPNVLLVHGWGEDAAGLGGFIAPLTNAGYRVIGMDLPGHGQSAGGTTNILDAGEAISDVIASLGSVHAVIGHSLGANAVLWAVGHCGVWPVRLVLLAPNTDLTHALDTFQYLYGLSPRTMTGLKRRIARRFGPGVWTDLRGDVLARDLQVPGLVFHDPEDPQVPIEGSRRLVAAWPAGSLVEVPGLGHGAITRDPGVIERAVSFLDSSNRASRTGRPDVSLFSGAQPAKNR